METAKPLACMNCHSTKGDGAGPLGGGLIPPPRNFTCGTTMKDIPDGQLFWIIKHGSPGTAMVGFSGQLTDEEIWTVIHYLRTFAGSHGPRGGMGHRGPRGGDGCCAQPERTP